MRIALLTIDEGYVHLYDTGGVGIFYAHVHVGGHDDGFVEVYDAEEEEESCAAQRYYDPISIRSGDKLISGIPCFTDIFVET